MKETETAPELGATASDDQLLTFKLRSEMFAVRILNVREIIEYDGITRVPMVLEHIRGVINLRGSVVPVVDLTSLFWKEPAVISQRSCIVIVELSGQESGIAGILVDSVSEVIDVHPEDIEPAPGFGSSVRADFICGLARLPSGLVVMLETDQLLSFDELHALARIDFGVLHNEAEQQPASQLTGDIR